MKFKLVYIVHLLIIILFVFNLYQGLERFSEFLKYKEYTHFNLDTIINSIPTSQYLRAIILVSFALAGVFFKNKIGWIFITYYFHLLIINSIIQYSASKENLGFYIIANTIALSLLIIMNLKEVSLKYYKINKENLIGINLISFVIGFCISILLFIRKNEYYLN